MAQLGERVGQVLGVDLLVGRVLQLHLPAVGRRGRGADEEKLAGVGQLEVAVVVQQVEGCGLPEVDATPLAHDGLAVPYRPYPDSGLLVEEGYYDPAEGLQR